MSEKTALLTCPWCPWQEEMARPTLEQVTEEGRRRVEEHHAARHSERPIKAGRRPRTGYYRGAPIS